ncbi:MAG: sigma-54-dependent Fis family transcriptional regulator [Gammaproteobacteria bacterium]|nr:sigma-54-dependent Fis family transcriptional regulator [Gammaproteobacteria bacterium]
MNAEVTRDAPIWVLIVDDEEVAVRNLTYALGKEGYHIVGVHSGSAALAALEERHFDVVLTDLRMEKIDGLQVLQRTRELHPETPVIVITGYATVSSAVDAMKAGAFHYVAKPFRLDEVRLVVRDAVELGRLRHENRRLRALVDSYQGGGTLLTRNPAVEKLLETARQVAATDCNIFITGESGTGKELLARYIHAQSPRRDKPFIAINCGAFAEELLANELFGHVKGAYTGANTDRRGLIEAASGGTLFLDEVTEMSSAMQAKLLRVVQEKELLRIGSTTPATVDVRYLAATNRDLRAAVDAGVLRSDLYYRLNVVNLDLPPLHERREDIALLAQYFLKKYALAMQRPAAEIAAPALTALQAYAFPGNVRELENAIERGLALAGDGVLGLAQLPDEMRGTAVPARATTAAQLPTLETQEADYIRWVLGQTQGNRTQAAQILGIDRVSLWRKLKKYAIAE